MLNQGFLLQENQMPHNDSIIGSDAPRQIRRVQLPQPKQQPQNPHPDFRTEKILQLQRQLTAKEKKGEGFDETALLSDNRILAGEGRLGVLSLRKASLSNSNTQSICANKRHMRQRLLQAAERCLKVKSLL